MSDEFSLLIRNGRLIDGAGNPYFKADLGVSGGRIARIERRLDPGQARKVIEADGLTVTPGFIDAHSHDDAYLLVRPSGEDKVLQGVTTVVTGNCGLSMVPLRKGRRAELRRVFDLIGGEHLREEAWEMETMADFMDKMEAGRLGINVVPLVGHGTIRIAVMGFEDRTPSQDELAEMKRLTAQAMEQGAAGLSTGLIYFPAIYAQTEEVAELVKVVGRYGGLYATHMRNESSRQIEAIEEALDIARQGGVPLQISHHKVMGQQNWGQSEVISKMIARVRAQGIEVTCDQYPYTAGSTYLDGALPPSARKASGDLATRLQEPDFRQSVIEEIESGGDGSWENMIKDAGFENIIISLARNNPQYVGKSIAEIAQEEGKKPYETLFDLLVAEDLKVVAVLRLMDEGDVRRIMRNPWTMVGTDGFAGYGSSKMHPRQTSTFSRILGRYVREWGVLRLEEAIRKMTSLPAQTFRIRGKGLLKEGFDADVAVFDPDRIVDRATFEDPSQGPEGISWVIVNGQVAVRQGTLSQATSGRVVKRGA